MEIHSNVNDIKEELIALRRDLHQHPEVAFQETRTASMAAEQLKFAGFQVETGIGKTGVVGTLNFDRPGNTLMIRADMDALPIQEIHGRSYGSNIRGSMHACGHDAHTSVALIVAQLLSRYKNELKGCLKVVFQPAEEIIEGAKAMFDDGLMKDEKPDRVLGFHCWPSLEAGKIGIHEGYMWANVDIVQINIKGVGGHGGTPHLTVDPISAAAHLYITLDNVFAREISPFSSSALSFGIFQGGTQYNIIPDEAKLVGSVRTLDPQTREVVLRRLEEISTSVVKALRAKVDVQIMTGVPAVNNNAEVCKDVWKSAVETVGAENVVDPGQATVGDDMSYFLNEAPGCYFLLGVANPAKGVGAPLHSPEFDIDENALTIAAETMVRAAVDYLG